MKLLKGKKTYLTAAASLLFAGAGYYTGQIEGVQALQIAQAALLGAFIRNGLPTR